MLSRTSIVLALATLLVAGTQFLAPAQATSGSPDWAVLSPEGEDFSILMPKDPVTEMGEQTYHKMVLKTRLYLSAAKPGPVLAVASISGIKSNPAMYSEFQRLNSYVDAFKSWFPAKVRSKEAIVKLTQKDDALQERFLGSFVIPERVIETPTTIARQPPEAPTTVTTPPPVSKPANEGQKTEPTAEAANSETKPAEVSDAQSAQPGQKRAPISGGVLNGRALYLPKPDYPPEAQSAKASGTVVVQVTIDEQGGVLSAHAVSGHPLLQAAAVAAAREARFSPTTLMGEPVKVTGVITYNFVR